MHTIFSAPCIAITQNCTMYVTKSLYYQLYLFPVMNESFHQPRPVTPCCVVISIALRSSERHSKFISKMALDEFILSFMFLKLNYCPPSVA